MKNNGLEYKIITSLIKFFITNVQINQYSKLLIIADEQTDPRVYNYIGKAAQLFIPSGNVALHIFKKTKSFHYDFPPKLIELLKDADIIISPTTVSIYHAKELQQALDKTKKFFQ